MPWRPGPGCARARPSGVEPSSARWLSALRLCPARSITDNSREAALQTRTPNGRWGHAPRAALRALKRTRKVGDKNRRGSMSSKAARRYRTVRGERKKQQHRRPECKARAVRISSKAGGAPRMRRPSTPAHQQEVSCWYSGVSQRRAKTHSRPQQGAVHARARGCSAASGGARGETRQRASEAAVL